MQQNNSHNNRRSFLKTSILGAAVSVAAPAQLLHAAAAVPKKRIQLKKGSVVLFQGDSITDAGRNRNSKDANNTGALGSGYAFMAASDLLAKAADKSLTFYNRGISGNKVHQLAARWQDDCIALKPDVLSIMIGVNDHWHKLNGAYNGTIETYINDYRKLLQDTRQALPNVQLIIGEPFGVKGIKAVDVKWYPEFDAFRAGARSMAQEFDAVFVPYQKVFDDAQKTAPGMYWTYDGVHPTIAGARLMADAWLDAVK